jgi:hypothetical protein
MFTNLSAVQINRLAQRLSEAPLGRSASVAAAAERFERLLAAKIGLDRAPKAIKAILIQRRNHDDRDHGVLPQAGQYGEPVTLGQVEIEKNYVRTQRLLQVQRNLTIPRARGPKARPPR